MVEGGGRERDKAAVPARAGAHHPHFGKTASGPRGGPLHHSCFDEKSQEAALRARKVR